MQFDLARPRFSLRQVAYAVLSIPVVLAIIAGLVSVGTSRSALTDIEFALLLVVIGGTVGALVFEPAIWFKRHSRAKRLSLVRHGRPDTLYVGVAQPRGFEMRAGAGGLGLLGIRSGGLAFGLHRDPMLNAAIEIPWHDVKSLAFRPRLDFAGVLHVVLRDDRHLSWLVRDDCARAYLALAAVCEAN